MEKIFITNKIDNTTAEILLYGYIYDACAADFIKELRSLEKTFGLIKVRINSGGGDVFDGFAIYNAMKQSPVDIHTYADGIAGSMGSIVLQGGKKRFVSKVAQVMTHKPSAGVHGNSDDLKKSADLLASVESMMCAIYSSSTGQSTEDCKAKFLNGKDNWFDATQALAEGLADEVYDAEPIALPAAASHNEEETWKGYHNLRFAAVFNNTQNQNENMELKLSAASKVALNIGDNADQTAIDAAITALKAKADQAEILKTAKEAAEQKLADQEKAVKAEKVTNLLAAAKKEKGISEAAATQFAADYKENPEGLDAILKTLPVHKTVVSQLKTGGDAATDEALVAEWDKLDKSKGGLERKKAEDLEGYKAMFKAKFGKEYTGK